MAGRSTSERRMGGADELGRLSAHKQDAGTSHILVHAIMLAIVLSVTVAVLVFTGVATVVSIESFQEMLAGFSWAPLEDLLGDLLHDILTDPHGAPLF